MTTELLSRIPVERLGWTLLHFLWQGTAISLLYATLRRVLGRSLSAQGRYVLASAALLLLTAAPILTFALNPTSEGPSQSPWSGHATPSQSPWSGHAAPSQFTLRVPQQERLLVLAVALWVAGVVVFSIRLFGGWRFAARLRSASNPPIARWQQTLESLATALGVTRRVRLLISPLVEVPVVVGWLRPAILVPVEFFTGFPAEHIRALLAHELAHVLRHDYLANLLQGLAETILFYHPAVWWISKQIRVEREKCCDDLAVAATGDVAAYVRALAELEARQANRLRVVMAANGGSLLERVRRLIEPAQASPENLPGPAAAWSMTLLWLAGIGAAAVHAAPGPLPVKPFIASPNPIPALVRMQAPSRRQEAFTEIKEKTRKALLYDPLLPAGPGTQSVPAIPLPEAPPALALSTDTSLLASLPGPDLSTGAVRPPREAPIDESPDAAVFHTATRLVLVDVIARGKGSRAAALTQQDFTLFDNGRPQAIAFFSPASALAPRPAPAPLAAGAVSNRLEQDGATPANATVLLIDQRNTPQPDQAFVIPRVRKFLESRRGSGVQSERVGIYAYEPTGDLKVVQELTDDSERLIRAAGALPPRPLIYTDGGVADTTERVLETNDVLEAVARHLATVPGRKNLVWISSGFPTVVSSRDSDLLPDFTPRMEGDSPRAYRRQSGVLRRGRARIARRLSWHEPFQHKHGSQYRIAAVLFADSAESPCSDAGL